MSGPRYDRILASTALALILAAPIGAAAVAQEAGKVAVAAPAGEPATAAAPAEAPAAPKDATSPATPDARRGCRHARRPRPIRWSPPSRPCAPDPLASLDPADRAVAEKIRDLLAAKTDKIFASKKERTAVDAFYQNRNLAPLWLDKGVENARAKAVIARLKGADADGLVAGDYKMPNFAGLGPDALAEAELKLTQTVLTYARHLQAGRFPYNRVSQNNIELPQQPPDTAEILTKIADAADAGKALEEFAPPHAGLQGAQGEARRVARHHRRGREGRPHCRRAIAAARHGRPARSLAAQASQCRRRRQQPALRGRAGRRGEGVPEGRRADRRRHARPRHRAAAQRPRGAAPQRRRRPRHRQHGALALVSARPRQGLFDRQPAGLLAQGGARRRPGLDHPDRDRQAEHGDAAAHRDDEIHHDQSDLERAAVDRAQRISAGAAAGSDGAVAHGPQGRQQSRRQRPHLPAARRGQCARTDPLQLPQSVPGLPARHAGQALVRA